jgi:hypothetical protein
VWQCLVVTGSHSAGDGVAVPRKVAQWRGWPHRAESDGGDALRWSDVTAPSWAGAGQMVVPLSSVPSSSFEGCDVEAVREWVVQCRGVDTGLPAQLPHSAGDGRIARVGGTTPGYDSQAVSEGRSWRGFTFDPISGQGSRCDVVSRRRP